MICRSPAGLHYRFIGVHEAKWFFSFRNALLAAKFKTQMLIFTHAWILARSSNKRSIHELQRLTPGAWEMIQSVCVRPLVWAYTQANWLGCWNSGPWNGWLCPLSNSKIPRGWVLNWNNGTCIHVNSQLAYRATRCYVWAYTQTLRLAALFKHANGWRCPLSNSELEPANGLKIP